MIADINNIAVDLTYLNVSTKEVTSSAQMIAAAAVEMAASVQDIARNSEGAAAEAGAASRTVTTGRATIGKAGNAIGNMVRVVEETARSVDELSRASQEIGQILGVIEGIASQTNLLALNAAIELARAGEAGRSFGVVAAEVKQLATQTSSATSDIAQRIAHLRGGMAAILKSMELSRSAVDEGQSAIGEAADTIGKIATQVDNVDQRMRDISGILSQQTEAAGNISRNINHVALTATENEKRLQDMAEKLRDSNNRLSAQAGEWHNAGDPRSLCEIAKIDHVLFKKRIVDTVAGYGAWAASEVPDHHGCRLGKWYDGTAAASIRSMPAFTALMEPHRRVHAAGRAALEACQRGETTAAVRAVRELNEASSEVLRLLGALSDALGGPTAERTRAVA